MVFQAWAESNVVPLSAFPSEEAGNHLLCLHTYLLWALTQLWGATPQGGDKHSLPQLL